MSGVKVGDKVALAHRVLEDAGVGRSPSWVSRQVRKYMARPVAVPFLDFLAGEVSFSAAQRKHIESNPEYVRLLELLMIPGNYAGRDHRKWTARHTAGE